jgi:hypothetical protein
MRQHLWFMSAVACLAILASSAQAWHHGVPVQTTTTFTRVHGTGFVAVPGAGFTTVPAGFTTFPAGFTTFPAGFSTLPSTGFTLTPMAGFTTVPGAGFSNTSFGCSGGNAFSGLSFGAAPTNQTSFGILEILTLLDRIASRTGGGGGTGGNDQVVQKLSSIETKLDSVNTTLGSIDDRLQKFMGDKTSPTPRKKPTPPKVPGTDEDPSKLKSTGGIQLPDARQLVEVYHAQHTKALEEMKAETKKDMKDMEERLNKQFVDVLAEIKKVKKD